MTDSKKDYFILQLGGSILKWLLQTFIVNYKSSLLPLAFLFVKIGLGTFGPFCTLLSLGMMPISLNLMTKFFSIRDSSPFYFSFTLYSMIIVFLVFELITCSTRIAVTLPEYLATVFLGVLGLIFICLTRSLADKSAVSIVSGSTSSSATTSHLNGEPSQTEGLGPSKGWNYNNCRKCNKMVPGRDHHCIWLNACISRQNKCVFMFAVGLLICWLVITSMINLTSICYPIYLFNGWGFDDGSSTNGRWLLIPIQCPDVFQPQEFLLTITFVVSIYALGVSGLLTLVMIHQVRLIISGQTHLERRYGRRSN